MTDDGSPEDGLPYDLTVLSLVTGIRLDHLQEMLDGLLSPSDWHIDRLSRVLEPDQVQMFRGHGTLEPEYVRSLYGRIPEGRVLLPYIPISQVIPGDLVTYVPSKSRGYGVAWVSIDDVEASDDATLATIQTNGIRVEVPASTPVRVARKMSDGDGR